ncbi:oxidoreductase [Candidatus Atribacteria bacterium HGW-Atribacteria-1]|nr:MAG: oxidoreductase [Candidatus Atribacteria bacterium HGW-Atribacteria-1]
MNKVAVIGAGNWGKNLVRNFYELGVLAAVCDSSPEIIEKMKGLYPDIKVTDDYEEILKDDGIRGVVVATTAEEHFSAAMKALKSGKDVFVEKPMTTSVRDAEALANEVARRKDVVFMVGHLLLYHPVLNELKALYKNGDLGNIYYLYSQRVNLGKIRTIENVIWSLAVHDVAYFIALVPSRVKSVDCQGSDFLQKGIQDIAFLNIYFDNGVAAHIHASWLDPLKIRRMTIVGDKKMAVFDELASENQLKVYDKGVAMGKGLELYPPSLEIRKGDVFVPEIRMEEPLKAECSHFLDCIARRRRPLSDIEQGLNVVRILDASDRAIKSASMVNL